MKTEVLLPAFEQAADAVVLIDEHNAITFFNAAAERLWGLERREVLGRNVLELVPHEIRHLHDGYIERNRRTGRNRIVGSRREVAIARGDGTLRWASFTLSRIDVGGRIHYMGFLRDVTEEVDRREQIRLLSLAVDETDRVVLILDAERRVVYVNRAFTEAFGYEPETVLGQRIGDFGIDINRDSPVLNRFSEQLWQDRSFYEEGMIHDRTGRKLWLSATANMILGEDGAVSNIAVILADITETVQIQALQRDMLEAIASDLPLKEVAAFICRQVEAIAPQVTAAILLVDDDFRLHPLAAPGLPADYGDAIEGLRAGTCGDAVHRGAPAALADVESDPLWSSARHVPLPPGLKACWSSPIVLRNGRVAGVFAFYYRERRGPDALHEQIVKASVHLCALAIERHENREHIARLSHFDALTGLPNRSQLSRCLEEALIRATEGQTAFLFLDLDHFKDINDSCGHAAGDELLIEVAGRLKEQLRPADTVIRLGGDEFVIILPGVASQRAAAVAESILETLTRPMRVAGLSLGVSASIGISLYPENGTHSEALLKQADRAMAAAKSHGRGTYRFFSADMNRDASDRLLLGTALRDAIANNLLKLFYQPQLRPDGSLYGLEALARWNDPDLGAVSPARFIALAEEIGQIEAIGQWSLREACRQLALWRAEGHDIPAVSVNLSPIHFRNPGLPGFVAATLAETGLPARCLTVEITEGVMMDERPETLETVKALCDLGIGLSLDDFGTGFSSLSKLARLPVTELKIDRSFMTSVETEESVQAVATAAIRIGQSLGMTVVAEGVENREQLAFLAGRSCDVIQGYLFARPMPASDIPSWLAGPPCPAATGAA